MKIRRTTIKKLKPSPSISKSQSNYKKTGKNRRSWKWASWGCSFTKQMKTDSSSLTYKTKSLQILLVGPKRAADQGVLARERGKTVQDLRIKVKKRRSQLSNRISNTRSRRSLGNMQHNLTSTAITRSVTLTSGVACLNARPTSATSVRSTTRSRAITISCALTLEN